MGITKKTKEEILAMNREGYLTHEIAKHFNIPEAIVVNIIELSRMPKFTKKKK